MFPKHTERLYNEKHSKKENKRDFKSEKGYILILANKNAESYYEKDME